MMMMMMTPSERVSSRVQRIEIPGACRHDARERHGACLLAGGRRPTKPSGPSKQPRAQRVISGGTSQVKGEEKTIAAQNMFQLLHRQSCPKWQHNAARPISSSVRHASSLSPSWKFVTLSNKTLKKGFDGTLPHQCPRMSLQETRTLRLREPTKLHKGALITEPSLAMSAYRSRGSALSAVSLSTCSGHVYLLSGHHLVASG